MPEMTTAADVGQWLGGFSLDAELHGHAVHVLTALPPAVLADLTGDAGVLFYDYDPSPGGVMEVPVRLPVKSRASRSIVLKRTLRGRSPAFVRWLIAHEIAHAHLRNGGRWAGDDPELAADALADEWGFARPSRW
jgi:hypothetical protein